MRKATGPISRRGKERSSRNAVKHGLNVATTDSSDPLFHSIAAELIQSGYSYETAAEAAGALLEYRRAMSAYGSTYWTAQYVIPLKESRALIKRIMNEFDKTGDYSLVDIEDLDMIALGVSVGPVAPELEIGVRVAAVLPLCRYQRKSVARLSKSLSRAI